MRWIVYNLLFPLGYLLLMPKFLWRMWRRGGYRAGFLQRFAVYGRDLRRTLAERPRIWVHAVSVGEMFVALKFIDALRRARPEIGFAITTTTSTGRNIAARSLHPEDVLLYVPCDTPPVVRRVLAAVRPRALILMECEVWPNMVRGAAAAGVPVILVNGRISERSFRGYRFLRFFFGPVLRSMRLLLVQTRRDEERLLGVGAPADRVRVMGSAKYDVARAEIKGVEDTWRMLAACGIRRGDAIVVGGSTWPGEEAALLEGFAALRSQVSRLKLILVPRHAERGSEVEAEIRRAGLRCVRRSAMQAGTAAAAEADVLLADTTGELRNLYACASVVFVGKSLTNHGGQNIIEPAFFGKPIIVGPNLENFPDVIDDFRGADAIVQVRDVAGLHDAMRRLLSDAGLREQYGRRAGALVEARSGVIERSVKGILAALDGA